MKTATIELDESEIKAAIKAAIEAEGWKTTTAAVTLDISPGYSGQDQCDYCGPSVKARVLVNR